MYFSCGTWFWNVVATKTFVTQHFFQILYDNGAPGEVLHGQSFSFKLLISEAIGY
jgi:hypothetical protein